MNISNKSKYISRMNYNFKERSGVSSVERTIENLLHKQSMRFSSYSPTFFGQCTPLCPLNGINVKKARHVCTSRSKHRKFEYGYFPCIKKLYSIYMPTPELDSTDTS